MLPITPHTLLSLALNHLMRVRVRSIAPLPTVKAWYEIFTGILEQRTIGDLKAKLCQTLFNAHKPSLTPANIVIELDEFELLDSSTLHVVRENDLLVVKYKATIVAGVKRKREQNEEISAVGTGKNKKRAKSSSSSSSSSSDSSSSSSSDSSSDSDSDTDTPPSTTLSKATVQKNATSKHIHPRLSAQTSLSLFPVYPRQPVLKASRHTKEQEYGTSKEQNGTSKEHNGVPQRQSSSSFVPPGEGKPSTQQRNQRRRKRRTAEKEGLGRGQEQQQMEGEPEQDTDTIIPSSQSASGDLALANFMFHTTKNDNKRRGFKEGKVGTRLSNQAFITDISSSSSLLTSFSSPLKSYLPRLIPPSERTDLPGNIIVSSVDVEASEWDRWNQPQTKMGLLSSDGPDGGRMQGKPEWERKWKAGGEGEFVATQRQAPVQLGDGDLLAAWDWDEVEKGWKGYPGLGTAAVEAGMVLLWKELALHPVSYTPEVMVHAGTVESVTEEGVELKLISRVALDEMEEEEGFEEEVKSVSRKRGELIGYRVYSQ